MAPDPGVNSTGPTPTLPLLDDNISTTESVSVLPSLNADIGEIIPEEEEDNEIVMMDGSNLVQVMTRSTFTTTAGNHVSRSSSHRNNSSASRHHEPSPSRHHRHSVRRQRLASHYLNQLHLPDHYLRHYYHHHQQSGSSYHRQSTHSSYDYPSLRRQTAAGAATAASVSPSHREPNERSPFLMIKILLFSMMTIDFVMNSIGLAVIIVLAKNHFNNIQVEQSLQQQHHRQQASSILPQLPPSLGRVGDQPFGDSFGDQITSEWSFLLPLLPSFIFVEILTLVGMFGVFCDLFSFTMTYAILKLITSLCYPSMASAAAVAAMATATSTATFTTTIAANSSLGPLLPQLPVPLMGNNSNNYSAIPMFDNFTYERSQNYLMPRFVITPSNSKGSNYIPNNQSSQNVLLVKEQSAPLDKWMVTESPTLSPTTNFPTTPFPDLYATVTDPSTTISSLPETTPQPATNNSSLPQQPSPDLSTPNNNKTTTSDSNSYAAINKNTNYKHTRLKYLEKELLKQKKNEKIAKLKAKDKQLRSRLLRMESQYTYGNVPEDSTSKLKTVPYGATITSSSTTSTGYNQSRWAQPDQNHARLSMILPIDQQHNIKYHHRVWDALLVTFEVIFAVAFAFNTLTSQRMREEDNCDNEDGTGTGRRRNRSRASRSASGRAALSWPYSPLPNSVDAYYFAQFHLPPPPPPYFCATSSGTNNRQSPTSQRLFTSRNLYPSSSFQAQFSPASLQSQQVTTDTAASRQHAAAETIAARSGRRWRRLTPSWFSGFRQNGRTQSLNQTAALQPAPTTTTAGTTTMPESPPSYDEIQHDRPVILISQQSVTTGEGSNTGSRQIPIVANLDITNHNRSSTERIVLQVMDNSDNLESRIRRQSLQHHRSHGLSSSSMSPRLRPALSLPTLNETILESDSEDVTISSVYDQDDNSSRGPASLPQPKDINRVDSIITNNSDYQPDETKQDKKGNLTNVTISIRNNTTANSINGHNGNNNPVKMTTSIDLCSEPEPKPDYVTNHSQTLVIAINDTPV